MKVLTPIQGHILLFTKGHYDKANVGQLEGLRRIWAVRCGLEYEHVKDGQSDEYIADELFRIIQIVLPNKAQRMWEYTHKELARPSYQYEGLTPIEILIMVYRSELFGLQVREKVNKRYRWIVGLPKPKKRIFKRILKGDTSYDDYKLIAA
jgi:hypothetical protein